MASKTHWETLQKENALTSKHSVAEFSGTGDFSQFLTIGNTTLVLFSVHLQMMTLRYLVRPQVHITSMAIPMFLMLVLNPEAIWMEIIMDSFQCVVSG